MTRFPTILTCGFASGAARYRDGYSEDEKTPKVVIDFGIEGKKNRAIVDTGAPWSIIDPEIIGLEEDSQEYVEFVVMRVRGELITGKLVRRNLTLYANEGEHLEFEATIFVPQLGAGISWRYPNFIGMSNSLDKLCFAFDPHPGENTFYFGYS